MQRWLDSLISLSSALDKKGSGNFIHNLFPIPIDETRDSDFVPQRFASPWLTLPVLPEIHTAPRQSLRTLLQPVASASSSHSTCAVLPTFSDIFRSSVLKMESLVLSFSLLLWSSSFTDKKWRMSSIYSAMHHLKVLSRSNFLLQPGVLSPYDFHVCFSLLYMPYTCCCCC